MGKLGPNIPNDGLRYTKSIPKSSNPQFPFNEVLLKGRGHLRVELCLF